MNAKLVREFEARLDHIDELGGHVRETAADYPEHASVRASLGVPSERPFC